MQSQIWASTIPLSIIYPSSSTPYLIAVPRLSYLPLLLPRLTSFFGPASSFSYQGIFLKNLPVGLLFDLYQPELPWRLELGGGPLFDIHDTYINSVKEVRCGRQHGGWTMTEEKAGRFHTKWYGEGDHEHVERKLYTTLERRPRQQVVPDLPPSFTNT
jgi:autophagy-related protein 5